MYPDPYIDFLIHFHGDRDYFECHEILEEYWKEAPAEERDPVWVCLIQIAVSLYHQRRGNFKGAERLLAGSLKFMTGNPGRIGKLGLHENRLSTVLSERLQDIRSGKPYESMDLPLADQALENACKNGAEEKGMVWLSDSDLQNHELVHRHMLRDRSGVIEERLSQLASKKKNT
ncbi:DUF309 domain-containing protein [Bacillus mangrovi]|uniref:DUF309 domain-containing protein n=1 Tax=Metabacillus mangrovi TaxID=1491830 RepID=A0A7X2S1Y2_9BACI|nr:DUF309 domain-containing protein [Metabacillus mangrovi]MTH52232.1 DUF309 domain-containing protein [Metabacillus mangrovi]